MSDALKKQANKIKRTTDEDAKIQKAIKSYLLKHPDFFIHHPDLVMELEVANGQGGLTDLTTHQLRTLQSENRQLKAHISELVKNAKQSESMMNRLFNLLTDLSVVKKADFLSEFVALVAKNFPTDYFKVMVADGLVVPSEDQLIEQLSILQKTHFAEFKDKSVPISGRLKKEKIQSIFIGVEDIKSAIVLPVGAKAIYGMLAFASRDEEKFHPNSSSDLLQKLTQVLAVYFTQLS